MPAHSTIVRMLATVLALNSIVVAAAELPRIPSKTAQFRRPAAIARLDDSTAVVANRCGTVSLIDLEKWSVLAEYQVGERLTDVAVAGDMLLVTDSERSCLHVIEFSRKTAKVVAELPMPTPPLTVRIAPDGKSCTVASKWARKLTFVTLAGAPAVTATVDLGFGGGEQLYIPSASSLLVADAFNGRLAVVNTRSREVEHVHEFGAHNIRGLALADDGKTLLISHQILNDAALPRRSDIIWGVMIDNTLRTAKLDDILVGKPGAIYGGQTINVGYAGQGAGDPDSLFVDQSGRAVIALAGVNEVSIGKPFSRAFQRIGVGRRPVDLMAISDDRFVVVNELSDSLTLIDMSQDADEKAATEPESVQSVSDKKQKSQSEKAPTRTAEVSSKYEKNYGKDYNKSGTYDYDSTTSTYGRSYQGADIFTSSLSLGSTPPKGPVERGEEMFFSARLSHASWFSCHSCHIEGHTNGGRSDTFGDDTEGAPKRVLSLLGVGETGPWGWNGKKSTLPKQIHQSAASTMRGKGVSDKSASDLAAFLKTLQPPPPYQPATTPADVSLVESGRRLFESLSCTACHTGKILTSPDVYDVGLVDERGLRKFNPPTLRGVGYREKLFHDKRATSLEDVFTKHKHQLDRTLSKSELKSLLRYLRSL